jgi:hypothetical protein
MSNADIFAFGICLVAGFLRVHQLAAYLGIALLAGFAFLQVHKGSGPWGLVEPDLQVSTLTVLTMAALYVATYWVGRLAGRMRN